MATTNNIQQEHNDGDGSLLAIAEVHSGNDPAASDDWTGGSELLTPVDNDFFLREDNSYVSIQEMENVLRKGSAYDSFPRENNSPVVIDHRQIYWGCLACRSRKVKCDEKKPACGRCLESNRGCVFPSHSSSFKSRNRFKEDGPETQQGHDKDSQHFPPKTEIREHSLRNEGWHTFDKGRTMQEETPKSSMKLLDGAPNITDLFVETSDQDEARPEDWHSKSWSSAASTLVAWPEESGNVASARITRRSPSAKKHKCPYCVTEFIRHHNLKIHLLTHSQEKPYVCQTCQSRFRRLYDLKRHTKTHADEEHHASSKCGNRFATRGALARHIEGLDGYAGQLSSIGSFGDNEGCQEKHDSMEGLMGAFLLEDLGDEDGDALGEQDINLQWYSGWRAMAGGLGSDDDQIARPRSFKDQTSNYVSLGTRAARLLSGISSTNITRAPGSKWTERGKRSESEPPRVTGNNLSATTNHSELALKSSSPAVQKHPEYNKKSQSSPVAELEAQRTSNSSSNLNDSKLPQASRPLIHMTQEDSDVLPTVEGSMSVSSSPHDDESDDSLFSANGSPSVLTSSNWTLLIALMSDFYALFAFRLPLPCHNCVEDNAVHNAGSYTVDENGANESGANEKRFRNSGMKRKAVGGDESTNDKDGQDDRKRSRASDDSSGSKHDGRLLACPFFKYDPRRYTCNNETGIRYRSCAGPGWESISRLKQHLKRSHSAPIQCPRCWVVMKDQLELSTHMRAVKQCEVLPPQSIEGIPEYRMEMIRGRHGITWREVFEIIFPGAPVPCCHYNIESGPKGTPAPQSPDSRRLADFEGYSRTELPRLVEANLETMIQAETRPIEAKMKQLLVDIVRRCQSTISQSWETLAPSGDSMSQNPQDFNFLMPKDHPVAPKSSYDDFPGSGPSLVLSSFDEPPRIAKEASMTLPEISDFHAQFSDSGYESVDYFCMCEKVIQISHNIESQSSSMPPTSFQDAGAMPLGTDPFAQPSGMYSGDSLWNDNFSRAAGPEEANKVVAKCAFCRGWLFVN